MNLAGRSRCLAPTPAVSVPIEGEICDRESSSPRLVSRLVRGAVGCAAFVAFMALAACEGDALTPFSGSDAAAAAAVPTVNLESTPASVAVGETTTLKWSALHAETCTASGGWSGTQPISGTLSTTPLTATTSYTITCSGAGGTASQSRQVVVTHQSAPAITLTASPTTISSLGSSTLTWKATNATNCLASDGWHGAVATSGTWSTGQLSNKTDYVLTCTGPGGSATQSVTVSVTAMPVVVTLQASPSTVNSGAPSSLTWTSQNATQCAASGAWSGTKNAGGSQSTGPLTASSTFTLTCTGFGGSATQSATVTVAKGAPTVTIGASPSTVAKGSGSTLTWSSVNATSCTASGGWSGSKAIQRVAVHRRGRRQHDL